MPTFRRKPLVVEAVQFFCTRTYTPDDGSDIIFDAVQFNEAGEPCIQTLEGEMLVRDGDWVIKGVNGEFYPCKPGIFEKTYEKVET